MWRKAHARFAVTTVVCALLLVWLIMKHYTFPQVSSFPGIISAGNVAGSSNSQSPRPEVTLIGRELIYGKTRTLPEPFKPALNVTESMIITDMLATLHNVMEQANLTYFMAGGTLLGSWRHHGRIPWDNDADVYIRDMDKPSVWSIKSKLAPQYQLYDAGIRWKVFPFEGRAIRKDAPWHFPFLDLCILDENATHMWDIDPGFAKTYIYPKRLIFPLGLRPFNGLMLRAPRKTIEIISITTDPNECFSGTWDHRAEWYTRVKLRVPCSNLKKAYPFVLRYPNQTVEVLQLAGRIISSVDP